MPGSNLPKVTIYVGVGSSVAMIFLVAGLFAALRKVGVRETKQRLIDCLRPAGALIKTGLTNRLSVYTAKRDWSKPDTHWSSARLAREICDDVFQNGLVLAGAVLSVALAFKLDGKHNPLIVNNVVGESASAGMLIEEGLRSLIDKLDLLSKLLVAVISVTAFSIVAVWCFTKIGDKAGWMRVS